MIEIIPPLTEYAELWFQWRSQAEMLRYNPVAVKTLEDLRARLSKAGHDLSDLNSAEEFVFFIRHDNTLVGTVTLKNINHMMMYAEIGYGIDANYQGRGLGTGAVRLLVNKIFSETKLRRLMAFVAEENIASRKLMEKVGFLKEGVCREHYIINGQPVNEVLYGLLRSEWER